MSALECSCAAVRSSRISTGAVAIDMAAGRQRKCKMVDDLIAGT